MVFIIAISITLAYLLLIGVLIYGFEKVPRFKLDNTPPKTAFSLIVPFRNEENNLPQLLKSIKDLDYPTDLYEIILVDDHSEDQSVRVIKTFIENGLKHVTILKNTVKSSSPKKAAIAKAIKNAQYDWVITTDADCRVPKLWLKSFDNIIQKTHLRLIAAPVNYYDIASFLDRFQTLDLLSLMGTTIGGFGIKEPFLANGANLAYQKTLFSELSGFDGSTEIASGDDVFLLQKAVKYNSDDVCYLKSIDATVETKPQRNWDQLVSQRLRWAAKATNYKSFFAIITGLVVFLMNFLIIILIPVVSFGVMNLNDFIYILLIKMGIDFLLIFKTSRFLNQESVLTSFLVSSVFYPFFTLYIISISFFRSYTWKGRTFKK
ncbi:Glycosyltransferase, catalytic subunit of cellulose synthase and poly-beta-1,6-N-acetylglucosamine synthase [Bizionia echini]|uniref:Glycosyltransferase, catalytic subunit of cellulose synthase and poly-beta-1,6-N-acetylglucosamine synthase n=1 Tax=Bizionia echini TaxID=649333 RepID=A0A1I4YU87_9FLAO|nr:glycosyltransferase [Bizionia echini]SFN41219.1 Glycosyltransferase, catalytic subunit of cellulose synthase and poly-beta-1,6-N-acetylglucosamine synthase [Bizionia echini]